jgi:asparagine synthase (glutamine-hydrolysing)
MCGIAGIYAFGPEAFPVSASELISIRDHMSFRGPDGAGLWISPDGRVGLAHRRLAIIDLSSAGAQPMASTDGRFHIVFNGEIYNYRNLRRELETKGHVFRSHCDTEVLLHLYADRGERMVHALRGMFAFAVWDNDRRTLFLARDPYGIKPIYYAATRGTFRVASQVKALLAGGIVSRTTDPAGIAGFYLWGSVSEPFTLYRDIRALPAGCTLTVDANGAHSPKPYFSISKTWNEIAPHSAGDLQDIVREGLLDSVRHHLVADVPVGAFLSAGIDSSALVGLMHNVGACEIQTITLGFGEFEGKHTDEVPLASEVAQLYGTDHSTRRVTQREFEADLPRIIEAMDQPSIDGINTWFVSKAAHERGLKVAISGLGGDELFGGYPSFTDIPRWYRYFKHASRIPGLGKGARNLGRGLVSRISKQTKGASRVPPISPKALSLLEYGGTYPGGYLLRRGLYLPWELPILMGPEAAEEGLRRLQPLQHLAAATTENGNAFEKVAALEASFYMRNQLLRDTDWASMAHSLEIRVPLVDTRLLERLASELRKPNRPPRKQLMALAPQPPLPEFLRTRPKTGFSIPVGRWMQQLQSSVGSTIQDNSHPTSPSDAAVHWSRGWAKRVLNAFC